MQSVWLPLQADPDEEIRESLSIEEMADHGCTSAMVSKVLADRELQALDRRTSGRIGFDHYCHKYNINYDRKAFWAYVREKCGIAGDVTWTGWDMLWTAFITREDARDLADTQRDALR